MAMPWELAEYIIAATWMSLAGWITACVALADGIACVLRRRYRPAAARRRLRPPATSTSSTVSS
ncbi:hypothetical protein ACP4OV_003532 [Aristida adscensionis]